LIGSVITGLIKASLDWHKGGQELSVKMAEIARAERQAFLEQANLNVQRIETFYQAQLATQIANKHEVVNDLHVARAIILLAKKGYDIDESDLIDKSGVVYDVPNERRLADTLVQHAKGLPSIAATDNDEEKP
jgi:hypothetical protein